MPPVPRALPGSCTKARRGVVRYRDISLFYHKQVVLLLWHRSGLLARANPGGCRSAMSKLQQPKDTATKQKHVSLPYNACGSALC